MESFDLKHINGRNIVLTGFMGTGKSTVGRLLAEQLQRKFVDMDDQLVAHFGKSVPEIFEDEGEEAFRAVEGQLCQQLAERRGLVIATGGGALVSEQNRQALEHSGPIVCLTADVETILDRLEQTGNRPLLPGGRDERRQRIEELLFRRRAAYASISLQVPTDGAAPTQIVERVLDSLAADTEVSGMTRIDVTGPAGTYPICMGQGLLTRVGKLMANRDLVRSPVAAVVTNPDIGAHYAETVADSLRAADIEPTICTVPEGETYKTLESVASLYDQFLEAGLDRRSIVLSLGGGGVGDMAGFAAATYLRGIPFVQIPTTLLSMVDASVGGKTGVDLPQGKNLVGAFKQPELVVIDTEVLSTLPGDEFRSGLAEIVKHSVIGAPDLFRQLEGPGPMNLRQLIREAVQVKVDVVTEDPFEEGRRAVLNLGHTFGHAIEQVSQYELRHGEAVSIGMVAAARMAADLNRCSLDLVHRIHDLLIRLGLPVQASGYDLDTVYGTMFYDKKRMGKTMRFIIPQDLGDVVVIDDPGRKVVCSALETVLNGRIGQR